MHRYLAQHPDVFISPVEGANFFSLGESDLRGRHGYEPASYCMTLDAYRKLFETAAGEAAVGEASPSYLCHRRAAERIRRYLPDARLVALLRQPAERAFSHFLFNHKKAIEELDDFRAALAAEEERVAAGWHYGYHYRRNGFYAEQLEPYLRAFPREQLLVLLYDDLREDPVACMQRIYAFLGVDAAFRPDTSLRYNVSGMPRNRAVRAVLAAAMPARRLLEQRLPPRLVARVGRALLEPRAPDPEVMAELTRGYREDILRTQDRIGRDLGHWLRAGE